MLLFTVFLVLVYGLVWMVADRISPLYTRVLAGGLRGIYQVKGGRVDVSLSGSDIYFVTLSQPRLTASFPLDIPWSNTAFFWTLLLVTPALRPARRFRYLAFGTLLLYLSQLWHLMAKVELTLIEAQHPLGRGSHLIWDNVNYFFALTGTGFFPVCIWLLLTLPYMLGEVDSPAAAQPAAAQGRNDPCACGSGKKYKYCCGRT